MTNKDIANVSQQTLEKLKEGLDAFFQDETFSKDAYKDLDYRMLKAFNTSVNIELKKRKKLAQLTVMPVPLHQRSEAEKQLIIHCLS